MDQQTFREIVSGERRGFAATLLRCLLRLLAVFYSGIVRLRDFFYSAGLLKSHRVEAVVICVGNITTGGTGKTPLVVWLCEWLAGHPELGARRCAILTRGYKSAEHSDEPALLAQSCPQVPVVVNPDRVAGATEAIRKLGAEILIMDDGFQHRRLHRDLDIVAIDATCPFGYGRVLPAGMLRESLGGLGRAGAFVVTRCDQAGDAELADIERRLHEYNPKAPTAKCAHAPTYVALSGGERIELEELSGMKVFAFCGIGNPDSFVKSLEKLGADVVGSEVLDDHHSYTAGCLERIFKQARALNAGMILTTLKDWTKIQPLSSSDSNPPLAYLAVEIAFLAGQEGLRDLIEGAVGGRIGVD